MKTKNLLWVAVIGMAASCTVSKRIDKWGYSVSFDKKQKTEVISEDVAEIPVENKIISNVVTTTQDSYIVEDAVMNQDQAVVNDVTVNDNAVTEVNEVVSQVNNVVAEKQFTKTSKIQKQVGKNREVIQQISKKEISEGLLKFLCIVWPWLAVGLITDWDFKKVLVCFLLTFLCWIPGIIYAFKQLNA